MPRSPVSVALVLCALALPVSIAGTNLALGLLAATLLLRARSDRRTILASWRAEPLLLALGLYAAAGLTAAAFSAAPAASLRDAAKDLHRLWCLGLFVAALALEPAGPPCAALGVSFSAMAAYGIFQTASAGTAHGMMVRASAFVHPVVFGEQMTLAVLGGACLLLRPAARSRRGLVLAFTVLVFTALVLSQTRMALLALFAGFALIALLEPRARLWALPVLLVGAAAAAAWEILPDGGRSLSAVFAPYDLGNPQQARLALWSVALKIFRDHPLTGAGPGGYHRLFAFYHPAPVEGETAWGSAHNLYLHQLAERGLLGGAALLILCATMVRRALLAVRRSADTRALWAAGAVAAFLAMCLTETSFQNEQFSSLLLLVWACGTVALRPGRENL